MRINDLKDSITPNGSIFVSEDLGPSANDIFGPAKTVELHSRGSKLKFPVNEHSSTPESSFSAKRKIQNGKTITAR